ncbi:interleukin-12 subunit alpha-like [Anomaloglossus baeobatrachus]|uniref:interleukin-12 subunit alpha-like n=1 Tax=Anomaloglossus baeobatrachus TaxID=238106 RepID=UPI003F500AB3
MRPPVLRIQPTTWSCCVVWMLVVIGQLLVVESKPVRQPIDIARCYNISRNLVNVVTETILKLQEDIHGAFNCSPEAVAIVDETANTVNTLEACLPSMQSQMCMCSQMTRTEVDEDKCLKAIYSDLKLNMKQLKGLNPPLDKTVTDMMQVLKVQDDDEDHGEKPVTGKLQKQFLQCSVIHYFQLRVITISRVFGQLAGEGSMHQKR